MAILTDSSIDKFLDKKFVIHPFDKKNCLTPLGYDLRIGYAIALNEEIVKCHDNEKVIIPAMSSMFIVSKEHVWLSGKVVGTLHSIGGLAAHGLLINSTTIDPNWSGQLTCLITNPTKHAIELDINSKFITMILHEATEYTNNTPQTAPIIVAKKYGNIYGEEFSNSLLTYITSDANSKTKEIFNEKIKKAQLKYNLRNHLIEKIVNYISILPNWIRLILITILIVITIFLLLLIPFWNKITAIIGVPTLTLDSQTFIAVIAVIVTLIVFITGLFKVKK